MTAPEKPAQLENTEHVVRPQAGRAMHCGACRPAKEMSTRAHRVNIIIFNTLYPRAYSLWVHSSASLRFMTYQRQSLGLNMPCSRGVGLW